MLRTSRNILKSSIDLKLDSTFNRECVKRWIVTNSLERTVTETENLKESAWDAARPYSEIPGPQTLREIRQFFPGGKYYGKTVTELHNSFILDYGKLVKMKGILGRRDMLLTFDPNDFELIHRTEGQYPVRGGMETLQYFRKYVRPEIYGETGGLLVEHGPVWSEFRKRVNPVMLQPKTVKQYLSGMDEIAVEFVEKIQQERDSEHQVSKNFSENINLWALESIALVALDTRLNAFKKLEINSDELKLITSVRNFFDLSYQLEVEPSLWKFVKTPAFTKQMQTLNDITDIIMKRVEDALTKLESSENTMSSDREESVLQKIIKINRSTGVIMAADMLLAGSDTTGSLAIGFLYRMALHPDKQQKLREEILHLLPHKNSKLSQGSLNNIPYLRACIKEAARLQSIVSGNLRAAGQNLVLQGYQVPKGTDIATANMYLHFKDDVFPQANEFIPERWLVKTNENSEYSASKRVHPFAFLPFGFGVRSCIGRRFAELELECLISRMIRNFHIEWNSKEKLKYKYDFLNVPIGEMPFRFKDLEY